MKEGNKNGQVLLEEMKVMQSWKSFTQNQKNKRKKSTGAAVHFINKDEIIRAKKEDEDC